jgi:putative ABC transport system permease protein
VLNAIAIGVTAAIVMSFVSVLADFARFSRSYSQNQLVRILVVPKLIKPGSVIDGMPTTLKPTLEQIDGIKVVQRMFVFQGHHDNTPPFIVVGEEDTGIELNSDFYPVDAATIERWKKDQRRGAIVTEQVAQDFNLEVGKSVELPTVHGTLAVTISGIVKGSIVLRFVAIHFDYAQEFAKNTDTCGYRAFAKPAALDHVIDEIATQTKNSPMPAEGIDSSRLRAGAIKSQATIPTVLGFLGLFLAFTTMLTLANNAAISIRERRIEIATLRVLGYYPGSILRLLVSEAVLVGLTGGIVVIGIMLIVFRNGAQLMASSYPATKFGPTAVAIGLAVSIMVPLIGTLPSSLAAIRVPLVEGLRQTA